MTWLQEYKSSLKNIHAEEMLDIYLFRPLAFIIVKSLYSLPLTPNHYSLMSLMAGILASILFYQGNFVYGAWAFFLFAVLDCCDGMQARMKKNGSEFGRLIDGLVDYFSNIACYTTLAIGVSHHLANRESQLYFSWPVIIILAGLSKALHSIIYDHFLMEYLAHDQGNQGFVSSEIEILKGKIKKTQSESNIQTSSFISRLKFLYKKTIRLCMLYTYLGFSVLQTSGNKSGPKVTINSRDYVERNLHTLKMWGLIGPAWHIFILVVALIFSNFEMLAFYSIVFGNLWMLFMFFYQQKINNSLHKNLGALKNL